MPNYKETLHREQVPEYFWELGIFSGYRPPGITIRQSLLSIFSVNNETFNVWTHLIALAFNMYNIFQICMYTGVYDLTFEYKAPLLCIMVASCIYVVGSIFAHTFSSMSEFSQHCAFMVDYLGICVYGFGTSLANLAYAFPPEHRNTLWEELFITVNFISASLAVSFTCKSRFCPPSIHTQLLRLLGFVLPYVTSMTVLLYRVVFTIYSETDATYNYYNHFVSAFWLIVFFMGHIPESLFPGTFDIYLHSHQIFHVLSSICTYQKLVGLQKDIASQYSVAVIPNCIETMITFMLLNAVLTGYYIRQKYNDIYGKGKINQGKPRNGHNYYEHDD